MKKNYVYIGQYYHIKNKELPLDYKFGVTDNLDNREYSLGRTKSPIKYMILKAWELPTNVKREKVEKLIAMIFDNNKYDGCEWYDIDIDTFQGKIATLFEIITDMIVDSDFNFIEVDLNKDDDQVEDIIEKEIETEIRTGKKQPWSNLSIIIDGQDLSGDSAKLGFINVIKFIFDKYGEINVAMDYPNIIKSDKDNFAEYKQNQLEKIGNFYIDTHSSTNIKKEQLAKIIEKYNLSGSISTK